MPNSFAQLVQPLLSAAAIEYLNRRNGFLDKIYIETVQNSNPKMGGQSAIVTLPQQAAFEPTDVDVTTKPTPQDVVLPSATVTFDHWRENVISVSDLQARVTRGNQARIIQGAAEAMIDSLFGEVDEAIADLYALHGTGMTVGTETTNLTDPTVRRAFKKLMDKKVKPQKGDCYLVLDSKGYQMDLLGIERYVEPAKVGEVDIANSPIVSGTLPRLFNVGVDWSHSTVTSEVSGSDAVHGMAFERHAFVMGQLEFPSIAQGGQSHVQESFIRDPKTGLVIRSWYFLDPDLRQWVLKYDICWGVAVLDTNRFCEVLYAAEEV